MLYQNLLQKISEKTAAYQIVGADLGTLFTNRGATAAVAFTLPVTADIPTGWWCEFRVIDADGLSVTSATTDTIIAPNDIAADSITITTTSLTIGAALHVLWDGTSWLTNRGGFGTYTVAT